MKKFAPIVAVAVISIMFTSCSKKYDCVCEDSAGVQVSSTDLSSFKASAKTMCKASDASFSYTGGKCSLK